MAADPQRLGPTRARDLLTVAAVAAVAAYVFTRFNYSSIPQVPRLAGITAALVGAAEAVGGWGLRSRIRRRRAYFEARARHDVDGPTVPPPPVPALFAARLLSVAKASALAGAAFTGLWIGFAAYVLPDASTVTAAGNDSVSAGVGVVSGAIFVAGALFLENCCRAPDDDLPHHGIGA